MIVSWRLHHITMLTRRMPDMLCTKGFSDRERAVLWAVRQKTEPPKIPPSLREITRMLAGLGGFLCRKGDGEPGVQAVEKLTFPEF